MSEKLYPCTEAALQALQNAMSAFVKAMKEEIGEADHAANAPAVLMTINDPLKGGTHVSMAGTFDKLSQSLATVLNAPQHAELKQSLGREMMVQAIANLD